MRSALSIAFCFLLCAAAPAETQDEDVSLGDLARSVRRQKPVADDRPVIDNDNLPIMMDKAEAERLDGKPVFSIDPSGKTFRMTSPDGTCSLSFDARAAALISTPFLSSELPASEAGKLEGTAAIHDGFLEITVHNGTAWALKEIVVGITLLNRSGVDLEPARLVNTVEAQVEARPPDATALYHLKATAAAGESAVFRAVISDELSQTKDWHWALVAARGIPPAPDAQALQSKSATPTSLKEPGTNEATAMQHTSSIQSTSSSQPVPTPASDAAQR